MDHSVSLQLPLPSQSSRTVRMRIHECAEFLVQLHKAFFIEEKYQPIRRVLDSGDEGVGSELAKLIDEDSEELIDFLNFFEFNAYLAKCGNISKHDLNAVLGYYFKLLKRRAALRSYIMAPENSFEHLKALLVKSDD